MSEQRSTSTTRIGVLAGVFGGALLVVLVHLWFLMVQHQDVWARRSYENRWAFRSVPSLRGRLLDRNGVELSHDESTTRVSVHYLRFRLRHSVGAAVHGASVCRRLDQPDGAWRYRYAAGALGPRQAVRDLFSMPVRAIEPGVLPKDITSQLSTYATTVLSQLGEIPRRQAYRAMREAAQSGQRLGIGDVLPLPRRELLARYETRLQELRDLSKRLHDEQFAQRELHSSAYLRPGAGADLEQDIPTLLDQLDELRVASFDKEQVTWTDDQGVEQQGSYIEELRTPLADDVSFDIAAVLRVEAGRYAGIIVEPSVRRVSELQPGTAFDSLLGRVDWLDRTVAPHDRMRSLLTGEAARTWVDDYLEHEMPKQWAMDLVPEGLVADEARMLMVEEARRRYQRELMVRERRGITGFEAWFNEELMGQLGMRFVEHDGNRREHSLWSHLKVESGGDVQVTIDSRLQTLAEHHVRKNQAAFEQYYRGLADPKRQQMVRYVEAAIVVIDANTGDLLACAGAPIVTSNARHVPGVMWNGNGSIGSVAKPFVLVEHLESQRLGLPHTPSSEIEMCSGTFKLGGRKFYCPPKHWGGGQSPREAICKSCNSYFYHVAKGLGDDAVRRSFERFGLLEPKVATNYQLCWQDRITGVSAAKGYIDSLRALPSKAIGYGVQASPLFIARAYAGLATGVLPTLGLRHGERRNGVTVPAAKETLDLVREAMRDVVKRGTAANLTLLDSMGVSGKTGTAERSDFDDNNAWFAGYMPYDSAAGHRLAFCSVLYYVPDDSHGGDTAGLMLEELVRDMSDDPELRWRYLPK